MDDEDAAGLDALQHLTGAEFESGDVHERRGRNEPAPGVEAEDSREEWSGSRQNYANESGRRRRLADTRASKQVQNPGRGKGMLTISSRARTPSRTSGGWASISPR